jgi:hypothetical protein
MNSATHQRLGPIGRTDDRNTDQLLYAIHFVQQAEQDALMSAAVDGSRRTRGRQGVDFVLRANLYLIRSKSEARDEQKI